jgi:hypothetical protein
MAILSKETLIDAAALGAGAAAASVVKAKLAPMILTPLKLDGNAYAANSIPILAGLFLPMVGGGSRIVNGLANGMIAAGAAGIVDEILAKVGTGAGTGADSSTGGGSAGVGAVFMNGVGGDQTLMGNADYDSYSSNSSDDTSADAGEMNF